MRLYIKRAAPTRTRKTALFSHPEIEAPIVRLPAACSVIVVLRRRWKDPDLKGSANPWATMISARRLQ